MIDLEKITSGVLKHRAKISPAVLATLDEGLSFWLCLIDVFDKCEFPTKDIIRPNFDTTKDEIFNEIHIVLTLAYHKKFRSASILTRSCVELAVYSIYFIDHPADCLLWGANKQDMIFSRIVEKIFSPNYIACMSGNDSPRFDIDKSRSQLLADYRTLSECVHGKPGFMSINSGDLSATQFSTVFLSSIRHLLILTAERLDPYKALHESIPTLETVRDE